jgi:hypothetical protein
MKSPTAITNRIAPVKASTAGASPGAPERIVPSPIRVPYLRSHNTGHRPVSPLTASDSMYGMIQEAPGAVRTLSNENTEERQQPSEGSVNTNNELVCDYDQSITPLYEMLESSQWEEARIRCRTHPQEVHTWIVRRDSNENIRWKLLPLHAAVIFQAPLPVIEPMLTEHPMASAKRDDQGMLPLHLAFRHKSDEILIEKLIRQYPVGVIVKDRRDRVPLDHAKDTQFSFNMMRLYSETYAKCQQSDVENRGDSTDAGRSVSIHDARLVKEDTRLIKEAYEARIKAMTKDHEQAMQELKSKEEKEAQAIQTLHNAEMNELRDLLSREVSSGQKVTQLEAELSRLSASLAEANREGKVLRRVVHEQKNQQGTLIAHLHQILQDQKSLHDFCVNQQEQLDEARQWREQLIRTLLQKEDGKAVQLSKEVCQLSNNILIRTESLLKESSCGQLNTDSDLRKISHDGSGGTVTAPAAATGMADVTDNGAWGAMGDHGDDISAITENSHF